MRFHREVVQPELNEIRKELRGETQAIRDEMATKAELQAIHDEMATKAELQAIHDEMATKAELQAIHDEMATKAELQAIRDEMATKAELQAIRDEMATKAELQAMRGETATKAELQAMRGEMVTWSVLMRFHQEIVRPEIDEVRSKLADLATRDEMLSHVDSLYVRFGILDSEYHALSAAVRRIEEQMAQQTVHIGEMRSELVKINDQISQLAQRVTTLENVLN